MLFYLFSPTELRAPFARLGYRLTDATVRRTIRYYSARATHGSTLSRVPWRRGGCPRWWYRPAHG